jgi:eukaryotic-like serine/threonine-protein kinase
MAAAPPTGPRALRFGPFELDPRNGELRRKGFRVRLQDQPLQILIALLECPGGLVTREELRQRLWPADTFVDFEHGLNAAVKRLRDALGDSAESPRFVETIPRRGYRFIAPVEGTEPVLAPVRHAVVWPRRRLAVAITAAALAAGLALALIDRGSALVTMRVANPGRRRTPVRFTIDMEQDGVTAGALAGAEGLVALSPDGSSIAYRGARQGIGRLYFHSLARLTSTALPGTEGAYGPFFSPDGRWLGFFAEGHLKKISLDTLAIEALCVASGGHGGSWAADDTIFFAARHDASISRVSAKGGRSEVVTTLDETAAEISHRWPLVLPDHDLLLYEAVDRSGRSRIVAESLKTRQRKTLVEGGECPRFAGNGRLIFAVRDSLRAVAFDPRESRMVGPPIEVFPRASPNHSAGGFDVSPNGTLAYVRTIRRATESTLWRVERTGRATPLTDLRRAFQWPRFSPDGRQLALTITDAAGTHLWTYDLQRRSLMRLTFEGENEMAIWTADSRHIVYRSNRGGTFELFRQPADGAGPVERLVTSDLDLSPGSWSPDGRTLTFQEFHPVTESNIWVVSLTDGGMRTPLVNSPFGEWDGVFSPDGRLVAYTSMESGRLEVYVRPYRGSGKRQLSNDGGNSPVWSRSGKELFYLNGDTMMVVPIESAPELVVGSPRLLFEGQYMFAGTLANYDVTPDDRAFVMIRGERRGPWMQLNVVLDWLAALEPQAPR